MDRIALWRSAADDLYAGVAGDGINAGTCGGIPARLREGSRYSGSSLVNKDAQCPICGATSGLPGKGVQSGQARGYYTGRTPGCENGCLFRRRR